MSGAQAPAAEPLPPGTSRVSDNEAEAFLVGRFGAGVRDVRPIGGGAWSKAYAFRRDGAHFVARFGGSISAEHGIGQMKRGELIRFKSPLEIALMRRIKAALDPKGILNPGKVL